MCFGVANLLTEYVNPPLWPVLHADELVDNMQVGIRDENKYIGSLINISNPYSLQFTPNLINFWGVLFRTLEPCKMPR